MADAPEDVPHHIEELRGATRLAVEATKGVTALVEEMHKGIASGPSILGRPLEAPVEAITKLVYGSIKGVTGVVGAGIDQALARLTPLLRQRAPGPEREAVVSVLNGVLGDYLASTQNPLAISMRARRDGRALPLDPPQPDALSAAYPEASPTLLVMVPGLCMNDRQWRRGEHDHGAALEAELGWSRVDLRYNSGLHISQNGEKMAETLEALVRAWPVEVQSIHLLAHSMGGLVARSAARVGELRAHAWRNRLRSAVFLGTPHHGAPLERGGNWLEVVVGQIPYAAPLARLGRIRSAGVTDLRYGYVLPEHWEGRDRFEATPDHRTPLPLPADVDCHALAGKLAKMKNDGMVPVASALGRHERKPELSLDFPETRRAVLDGVGHIDLLDKDEVYPQLRVWFGTS